MAEKYEKEYRLRKFDKDVISRKLEFLDSDCPLSYQIDIFSSSTNLKLMKLGR